MLHEPKEKRQVSFVDSLFIEREDEIASLGVQKIIGILNPFGNSFQGKNVAKIIVAKKASEVRLVDFGIDSHGASARLNARAADPRRALVLATPMQEVKRSSAIVLGLAAPRLYLFGIRARPPARRHALDSCRFRRQPRGARAG